MTDSPSLRKLFAGIEGLPNDGHPNVPALLRRIANDIENGTDLTSKTEKDTLCGKPSRLH